MSAVAHDPRPALEGESPRELSLIDCDAHHNWSGVKDVLPYLPRYWADYVVESQFKSLPNSPYPKGSAAASGSMPARAMSAPPDRTSISSAASSSTSGASTSRSSPASSTTWPSWRTPGSPRRWPARSTTG